MELNYLGKYQLKLLRDLGASPSENEKKDVIIHGEERKINSSGTTTIENYRNTVTDILNSYQNYAQILIPLTWKYSDSDTIYDNLISQVVEELYARKSSAKRRFN